MHNRRASCLRARVAVAVAWIIERDGAAVRAEMVELRAPHGFVGADSVEEDDRRRARRRRPRHSRSQYPLLVMTRGMQRILAAEQRARASVAPMTRMTVNGEGGRVQARSRHALAVGAARCVQPHRHEIWLRQPRLRRVHGDHRRPRGDRAAASRCASSKARR